MIIVEQYYLHGRQRDMRNTRKILPNALLRRKSAASKKRWEHEGAREHMSQKMKEAHERMTPEQKAERSEKMKKAWEKRQMVKKC